MLYLMIFDAKESTTQAEINNEREAWIQKGKERLFQLRCKNIERFEVVGRSPMKIFFIVDTDEPTALSLISHHFGDAWNSITFPVIKRSIDEALEEDRAVIGG